MFRRIAISSAGILERGSKPFRDRKTVQVVHQAERRAMPAKIDYTTLGLEFLPTYKPEVYVSLSCWTKPPETKPNLPFSVVRSEVGNSLPVYTDYKAGRTKVITMLTKCSGNIELLKSEMEKIVGKEVQVKPGKLVVDGNYQRRIKLWLAGLGF